MMVYNTFSAENMHFKLLQISPQIFANVRKFTLDLLRDQQFDTLLCE